MPLANGYLRQILAAPGTFVHANDCLVQLDDPLNAYKLQDAQAAVNQAENMVNGSADNAHVVADAAQLQRKAAWDRLHHDRAQTDALTVRAPRDGIWVAPQITDNLGAWLPRGSILGEVISPDKFHFLAVVPQSQAAQLFSGPLAAWIRLPGQSFTAIRATSIRIIPSETTILPSAALGWAGGGDIQTEATDSSGLQAKEPFYFVYADLDPQTHITLAQRQRGVIRFSTTWEPLLTQLYRTFLQTFQERVETPDKSS